MRREAAFRGVSIQTVDAGQEAQIRAVGQVLANASGLELELTRAAAAGVVILYTMVGGMLYTLALILLTLGLWKDRYL